MEIRPRLFDKQKFTVTRTAIDLHIYSRNFPTKNQHRTEIDIFRTNSLLKALSLKYFELSTETISPVCIQSDRYRASAEFY